MPCHDSVRTLDSNFHWPSDLIIQILNTCTNMYYVHLISQECIMPLKLSRAHNLDILQNGGINAARSGRRAS